jgi:hypothetical protein
MLESLVVRQLTILASVSRSPGIPGDSVAAKNGVQIVFLESNETIFPMKVRFCKKKLVLITNKPFIVYQPLVNAVFYSYFC